VVSSNENRYKESDFCPELATRYVLAATGSILSGIAIAKAVRTQSVKRIPSRPADNQIVLIACGFDF